MQELRPLHIDIAISKDGTNGLLFTDDRHIRPEQVGEDPGRRQGGSRCCSFYFHFSFFFLFYISRRRGWVFIVPRAFEKSPIQAHRLNETEWQLRSQTKGSQEGSRLTCTHTHPSSLRNEWQ